MKKEDIWRGLQATAKDALGTRDYRAPSLAKRLAGVGLEAGQIVSANRRSLAAVWIPGVEIFPRTIYVQRHRGLFGEFARRDEGVLANLKFWPRQWATARMFANTAKGFHVHPPFVPAGEDAAKWLRRQFARKNSANYEAEQWDVMFFVQGRVEMILRDVREGFRGRIMHFYIDGDNHRSPNNVGVVIPRAWRMPCAWRGAKMPSWFTARARTLSRPSKAGSRATWNQRCCRKVGVVFWRNK